MLNDAHRSISSFEFARTFTCEIENHWDEISETLRGGRLQDGISGSFERYIEAKRLAEECRTRLDALLGDIDVLLTPAAFGEAPVGMPAFAGVPLSSSGPPARARRFAFRCSRDRPACRSARSSSPSATTTASCSPARNGPSEKLT